MRSYDPRKYHCLRGFGAIGNALSHAAGIAVAADGRSETVLFEGDGGLLMHIQELETIARHGIKLLVIAFNDGGFGSEIHQLRNEGLSEAIAIFGRPDLVRIARGFGLAGETVTDLGQFPTLWRQFRERSTATVWDVHVNDLIPSPTARLAR